VGGSQNEIDSLRRECTVIGMNTKNLFRLVCAVVCSLAAFVTVNAFVELDGGLSLAGFVPLFVLLFGGMLYAQFVVLDVFRGTRWALLKATALQPAIPFAVFLGGGLSNIAMIQSSPGRGSVYSPSMAASDAVMFAALFGIVGAVMLVARDAVESRRRCASA